MNPVRNRKLMEKIITKEVEPTAHCKRLLMKKAFRF